MSKYYVLGVVLFISQLYTYLFGTCQKYCFFGGGLIYLTFVRTYLVHVRNTSCLAVVLFTSQLCTYLFGTCQKYLVLGGGLIYLTIVHLSVNLEHVRSTTCLVVVLCTSQLSNDVLARDYAAVCRTKFPRCWTNLRSRMSPVAYILFLRCYKHLLSRMSPVPNIMCLRRKKFLHRLV